MLQLLSQPATSVISHFTFKFTGDEWPFILLLMSWVLIVPYSTTSDCTRSILFHKPVDSYDKINCVPYFTAFLWDNMLILAWILFVWLCTYNLYWHTGELFGQIWKPDIDCTMQTQMKLNTYILQNCWGYNAQHYKYIIILLSFLHVFLVEDWQFLP